MFYIDYNDKRPIYIQISDKIKQLIISEYFTDNLPSVRQLALQLEVNPNTIQKAYALLEKEGYIYNIIGKGCFVSKNININTFKENLVKTNFEKIFNVFSQNNIPQDTILKIFNEYFENYRKE